MSLPLALYALISRLAEPWVAGRLRQRARAGKEDLARLPERLGVPSKIRPQGHLIWLHGVSVGETLSLLPLVSALRTRHPHITLLVTSGTRTSANLLDQRLPEGVIHQYIPVDTPNAVQRFLDHWKPDLGIFAESELWPNLILTARSHGVRLALISARITQKSAEGWGHFPVTARALLEAFELILPQDKASAQRLTALGGHLGPTLNLKRIGAPLSCDARAHEELVATIAGRRVILASNTHPGEEQIIGEAALGLDVLLIVAPRHPERGASAAEVLRELGYEVIRRSEGELITHNVTAYVADTLGEMGLFYQLADLAIMGGSLVPGIGGHNPLEAARLGVPVVSGPEVFNAAELYEEMLDEVAAIIAQDGKDLARHLSGLVEHDAIRQQMSDAGLRYARRQDTALGTALTLLSPLMPTPEAP